MSKRSGNSSHRSPSSAARIFGIISHCQAGASSRHSSSARARSSSVTTIISPVSGPKYEEQSSLAASKASMISRREMAFDMASNTLLKDEGRAEQYYGPRDQAPVNLISEISSLLCIDLDCSRLPTAPG